MSTDFRKGHQYQISYKSVKRFSICNTQTLGQTDGGRSQTYFTKIMGAFLQFFIANTPMNAKCKVVSTLNQTHTMKAWENRSFLTTVLDGNERSTSCFHQLYTRGNCLGNRTPVIQPVASYYTD